MIVCLARCLRYSASPSSATSIISEDQREKSALSDLNVNFWRPRFISERDTAATFIPSTGRSVCTVLNSFLRYPQCHSTACSYCNGASGNFHLSRLMRRSFTLSVPSPPHLLTRISIRSFGSHASRHRRVVPYFADHPIRVCAVTRSRVASKFYATCLRVHWIFRSSQESDIETKQSHGTAGDVLRNQNKQLSRRRKQGRRKSKRNTERADL